MTVSRAGLINAITRVAHTVPFDNVWAGEELEGFASDLMQYPFRNLSWCDPKDLERKAKK